MSERSNTLQTYHDPMLRSFIEWLPFFEIFILSKTWIKPFHSIHHYFSASSLSGVEKKVSLRIAGFF